MKTSIVSGLIALLLTAVAPVYGQRSCGTTSLLGSLEQEQPAAYQKFRADHRRLALEAQQQTPVASKTTAAQHPVPVVFHILISQTQFATLGGDAGIKKRVASQLAALNRDFNQQNADANLIPSAFKSLYGNANIQFGLSTQTSALTTVAAGIELKILTGSVPSYNVLNGCRAAKDPAAGGLAAWDPSKYLNVWIIRTPMDILGVSISPSLKGYTMGGRVIDESDFGVVLSMGAFGVRESASQTFSPPTADMGRTLTHEVGHYFELFHIWGDDDNGNAAGYCPGDRVAGTVVGWDDDIRDTPPQARRTYCDFPNHAGSNCPGFPLTDACSPSAPGVMFMNFMDYVDDRAMYMFTHGQVAMMRTQIAEGGASFGLTQSPGGISLTTANLTQDAFNVYPNPATGIIHIALSGNDPLQSIQLSNLTGQVIRELPADGRRSYELRTGDLPRGLYFVQCRFAGGTVSRKIVLQ